jgi:hypothetical protein
VLVASRGQVLVAGHQVVEILHLEGDVVELDHSGPDGEEGVVVDVLAAAIATHEGGEHMLAVAEVDLVGVHEAEVRMVEGLGLAEVVDQQDEVAEPLHVRRAALDVLRFAKSPPVAADVDRAHRRRRDGRHRGDAVHHLHNDAVRIGEPHALPAARLVDRLDGAGACGAGDRIEIGGTGRVQAHADEPRVTELGDVEMMLRVGAAHVERGRRARGAHEAEVGEKGFHPVEVGCAQANVGEVGDFDHGLLTPETAGAPSS